MRMEKSPSLDLLGEVDCYLLWAICIIDYYSI